MKIDCSQDWEHAVNHFLNPRNEEKMASMGLSVEWMDWNTKVVCLKCSDDPRYARIIARLKAAERALEMSSDETTANPDDC